MAFFGTVGRIGQPPIVRFNPHWVRDVAVVFSITLQRYAGKKQNIKQNYTANQAIIDTTENQNVNFINYNEQYDSHYDSSDNNYVAMLKQNNSKTIASQIMNMTICNTDCNLLLNCTTQWVHNH